MSSSHQAVISQALNETRKVIVGQEILLKRLLMGLLLDGHILLEGLPGLAKTTAVKTLARVMQASFHRIQFTPDLLPADITGTQIYNPKTQEFSVKKGPLFHQIVLADEINRAPAKVQSALLEAMQERQVTIGETSFKLPSPFIVLATQNPLEQEGTYPLPEAQLDRFLFKVKLDYPTQTEELEIIHRHASGATQEVSAVLSPEHLGEIKKEVEAVHVDPKIVDYIVRLVQATRDGSGNQNIQKNDFRKMIAVGVSPRGSMSLYQAVKAYAYLEGRDYVVPQDVKEMAPDVFRHRLILSLEAEVEGQDVDQVIQKLLETVSVP